MHGSQPVREGGRVWEGVGGGWSAGVGPVFLPCNVASGWHGSLHRAVLSACHVQHRYPHLRDPFRKYTVQLLWQRIFRVMRTKSIFTAQRIEKIRMGIIKLRVEQAAGEASREAARKEKELRIRQYRRTNIGRALADAKERLGRVEGTLDSKLALIKMRRREGRERMEALQVRRMAHRMMHREGGAQRRVRVKGRGAARAHVSRGRLVSHERARHSSCASFCVT